MIKWGGRILMILGAGHLLAGLALTSPHFAGRWLRGRLVGDSLTALSPASGAFWLTVGSFGIPLIVLGATVSWLDRRGLQPPLFIAWTIGIWSVLAAVMFRGAPWLLAWIAVGLLILGARRARSATPVVAKLTR